MKKTRSHHTDTAEFIEPESGKGSPSDTTPFTRRRGSLAPTALSKSRFRPLHPQKSTKYRMALS